MFQVYCFFFLISDYKNGDVCAVLKYRHALKVKTYMYKMFWTHVTFKTDVHEGSNEFWHDRSKVVMSLVR